MKRSLILLVILCAAAPAVFTFDADAQKQRSMPHATASKQAAQKPGAAKPAAKPAPKINVQVIDETGLAKLLKDEAARGGPLLVNFWATWCAPCREEFPDLVKIEEEFGAREGFEFVTVSLDDPSDLSTAVPRFLAEMRAGQIPAYLLNAPDHEAVITLVDKTWRGELPATFLYGRDGRILYKHTGRIKPDELRKAIDGAMSGTTATEK